MPQRRCCVASCCSTELEGAVLHSFPNPMSDPERFKMWITNTGLSGEAEEYVYKNRRICDLHFEEIYHYPNNRLNKLAIPTLHVPGAALALVEHIDLDQPLLSQPMLAGITVSTESGATRKPTPMMLNHPQPSTSREIHTAVSFFMDDLQPTTSTKSNTAHRTIDPTGLDKVGILLYEKIAKTQAKLQKCKETKAGLKNTLKLASKLTKSAAYKLVTKHLSPAAKTFFAMQIRQANKKPKGRRFTLDEKILALSLYKPSPKAYRLLSQICVLPKKSTLNKLITNIPLGPGPNDIIFDHLKKRVKKMPASHKYCILIFDEMAISANLSYDKHNDKIIGFCDSGSQRSKSFADHVLVFMVRGIFKKYKQTISYSFCSGTTKSDSLKGQIKIMIEKILQTGLRVVATTCDQGSSNMSAINSLMSDTREIYMRQGKEYRGGFFEINENPIYAIYDPPHLLKGIRNNLLRKNLEYILDKKIRVAKWEHVESLYKKRPGYKGVRLLPKLTARHAIPHLIPKMKVKYCTQVFSRTVSVVMGITARYRHIPRESTDTADLLMFFDSLFDSVNGSYSRSKEGKIYRSAVKPKSPHWKLWDKSLPVLKSMKFLGANGKGVVPSISSWIKTIEAFQQICKKLHSLGLKSLLLRNFNQDPLENFFGAIRAHGHSNTMPSSAAFEASYKALIVSNMVSPKTVGANCETDNCYCLENLKLLVNTDHIRPLPAEPCTINMEDLNIILPNIDNMLASQNPADLEKCAAAAYCSGWIINLIYKKIGKNCEACKIDLEGGSEEEYSLFIHMKKNTEKSILHYPNKNLLECFIHLEVITIEILKNHCESAQIATYIELIASTIISFNLNCTLHKETIVKFISHKSVIFFIQDWCTEINNILSGKNTINDSNDVMKKLAYNHFMKKRTKKRYRVVW